MIDMKYIRYHLTPLCYNVYSTSTFIKTPNYEIEAYIVECLLHILFKQKARIVVVLRQHLCNMTLKTNCNHLQITTLIILIKKE
jgi:hypothetical protein